MRNFLFCVLIALALPACSSTGAVVDKVKTDLANSELGDGKIGTIDVAGAKESVLKFARADVEAALADATSHNDILASTCYQGILTHIDALNTGDSNAGVKGAVSAFQKARNVRRGLGGGLTDEMKLACGPLFIDVQGNIAKLLAKFGAGPLGGLIP